MVHETCWTLIHAAGAGDASARGEFALRYLPIVRSSLAMRWQGTPLLAEIEDAAQDVVLECFRARGALQRAAPGRGKGFRAFLFGVVRTVALHKERARARTRVRGELPAGGDELVASDESWATAFDRAWAKAVMQEAAALQVARAREKGGAAAQRAELLRLRFHEGLAIREIAEAWQADAARVHHEYALAREEFAEALRTVVEDHTGDAESARQECARLLGLLA